MAQKNKQKLPYKIEWDLKLFYKNGKDPQIAKDIESSKQAVSSFAKKYKDKDFTKNTRTLLEALKDHEELEDETGLVKVARYFGFRKELDARDSEAEAKMAEIAQISADLSNELVFFALKIGKIENKKQKEFLSDNKLKKYHYFLKVVFDNAKYLLTEPEEKILNLKRLTSKSMWITGSEKLINKQTIKFNGKEMPLPQASGILPNLKTKDRRDLYNKIIKKLYEISDFAESELNAVVTNRKIDSDLRGYNSKVPFEATALAYENNIKTVETLRESVKKYNRVSHNFYKIKAKLLGEKKLIYGDRSAQVGKVSKKISFEDAKKVVHAEFAKANIEFAEIFEKMIKNGQIDVYPKEGKSGGAFCAGTHGLPTFILLNHTDDLNSLSTLAHEMGHALHTEYSKKQPAIYEDYSTATAEVASTFFETLVFDSIFEKSSDKDKILLLHDKLQDDIQTIFRQIACFEFEIELHNTIREKSFLSKEDMARLMNKHMKAYLGPVFDLEEIDGYFFVSWPHLRYFFYVYSYAFGQIVSRALYAKYKEDKKFIEKIKEFLSAGGSMSPEDIFKSIGIDVTKADFFETGLKEIEAQVKELEKLVKKQ